MPSAASDLDASLLLLADLGLRRADDPRFIATVDAIGRDLRRGDALFRYIAADDFGKPGNRFNICTFWYIDALAAIGRKERGARHVRGDAGASATRWACCRKTSHPTTGEAWGNFPQTYSHGRPDQRRDAPVSRPGTRRELRGAP